ncbi:hypothetical protein RI844_19490 [Thalassotalea fonticola]|uniref:Alpha/beta hydrolase n=1 Tax=Thalassotalea fonticola TaxID=3065649 RepID=A0ABZ0GP49_9GAMM|nr:hypothetical protein RI844_19490 [Colwelliaceae bacterium S1-1]
MNYIKKVTMGMINFLSNVRPQDKVKVKQRDNILVNVPHYNFKYLTSLKLNYGESTCSIFDEQIELNFYSFIKKESSRLIILLPGAVDRSKGAVGFQRYTWAKELNANVISFSDPTITESNDLKIGWFQNVSANFGVNYLYKTVKSVQKQLNIKDENVCFFGSSAGGFASLKVGEFNLKATVIAINPQIYLKNYSKNFYIPLLKYSYDRDNDLRKKYINRLKVDSKLITKRQGDTVIYQNIQDKEHVNLHLTPFINMLKPTQYNEIRLDEFEKIQPGVSVILYDDIVAKHSPPGKSETIDFINQIFDCDKLNSN